VTISPDWTSTRVMVVPTNEELAIARQAIATIERAGLEGTSDETDPSPASTGHA
jgi:acetate kinase